MMTIHLLAFDSIMLKTNFTYRKHRFPIRKKSATHFFGKTLNYIENKKVPTILYYFLEKLKTIENKLLTLHHINTLHESKDYDDRITEKANH